MTWDVERMHLHATARAWTRDALFDLYTARLTPSGWLLQYLRELVDDLRRGGHDPA